MGLDIVEFVAGVEEAFGIRIPDEVAPSLATPRRLIDYVHGRLPRSPKPRCLSQRAFYAIRRELARRVGAPPSHLRPSTELLCVLPSHNAQTVWLEVGESLGWPHWPRAGGGGFFARIFFPSRPRTLGDVARHAATFTPGVLKPGGEGWAWCEVAAVIDGLMRYHFAVRDYSLDDSFVEDLGLD